MKKKECPSCAMDVGNEYNICPVCGYEFPKVGGGVRLVAFLLIILLVLLMFFI